MDPIFRKLCEEVLKENLLGQRFNELLIETGVSLESSEWDLANRLLNQAEEILAAIGGKPHFLN